MFKHCLFCHTELGSNETIEHFPVGKRVAYDPARGRLWAVCGSCGRWNLAPIEERWEALEEVDRMVTDRGRLLAQTENIALARLGEIDVVRVGRANLNEEAWWRYGRELKERRTLHSRLGYLETAAMLGLMATGFGIAVFAGNSGVLTKGVRWLKYGSTAWRGSLECGTCGETMSSMSFRDAQNLSIIPGHEEDVALHLRCWKCRQPEEGSGYRLEGVQSHHLLRRVLSHQHFNGASEKRIKSATALIDNIGSSAALAKRVAVNHATLRTLSAQALRTESIALEIALNDENERHLLELELEVLEQRWKEEEELAAIVDRELTPLHTFNRLIGRG